MVNRETKAECWLLSFLRWLLGYTVIVRTKMTEVLGDERKALGKKHGDLLTAPLRVQRDAISTVSVGQALLDKFCDLRGVWSLAASKLPRFLSGQNVWSRKQL